MKIQTKWTALWAGFCAAVLAYPVNAEAPEQGAKPVARGNRGMVSASHPAVSEAMLGVLKKGGNAIDAVIAGTILQPVIEPQMTSLSGGLSMLVYEAKTGELHYMDAELNHTREGAPVVLAAPWSANRPRPSVPENSGRRVGVPGTLAGLHAAAERFGTLPWADYFKPAIDVAEQGYPMYSFLYGELAEASLKRVGPSPTLASEFLPAGFPPPVGEIVKRPRLAKTMRSIAAEGPDYFYRGPWARNAVDFVAKAGGRLSMQDLADYQVYWDKPVRTTFKGYEIASSPPPATAGTLIGMVLNILEPFDLAKMPHFSQSASTFSIVRQAFSLAEFNSENYVKDPRAFEFPQQTLLSKEYAALLTSLIKGSTPLEGNLEKASAASTETGNVRLAAVSAPGGQAEMNTVHLVAVDRQGNWVSATHTIYGGTFGTGVVDGVTLNGGNTFAGTDKGEGRRVISPFPPTLVLQKGKPYMAIGSPGLSSRAVAQVLINHLGFGMDLVAAVDAPRFSGAQPGTPSRIEARFTEQMLEDLPYYEVPTELTTPYNWHFGSIQAIARDGRGLIGVADPRRGGLAAGY